MAENHVLFDVRSESEFSNGHIPGAFSLPLFSDEERAEVGTLYKKKGKLSAYLRGLDFASGKMRALTETVLELGRSKPILLYCWRGGMRSGSVAWLLEGAGIKVHVLQKGYKEFRRFILEQIAQKRTLKILGGKTGSGKTQILQELKEFQKEQTVNLEQLANHKGSAFGGLGQEEQPTQEHFENLLGIRLFETSAEKAVWMEDESRLIGKLIIPEPLWSQMRNSPVYVVDVEIDKRIQRLVEEYGMFTQTQLKSMIIKISNRLGGQRLKDALQALEQGDLQTTARICLEYYDKSYAFGLSKRDPETIFNFEYNHVSETSQ